MTPEEEYKNLFLRIPSMGPPQWAFPYEPVPVQSPNPQAAEGDLIIPPSPIDSKSRDISLSDLHNVPIDQRHQPNMNEEQWTSYMTQAIEDARRPVFIKHRAIPSAPPSLFEVKPRSYCPRIVTLGPLCRNLESTPMDRCKAMCVKEFMRRNEITLLSDLLSRVIPKPEDLENIYFGLPTYILDVLQLMVAVDTVFFYEFLLFVNKDCSPDDKTSGYFYAFLNNEIMISQMRRDLFLIGNQIPVAFLKSLTQLPSPDVNEAVLTSCLQRIVSRGNPFITSHSDSSRWNEDLVEFMQGKSVLECEHILDCLYVSCVDNNKDEEEFMRPRNRLPTASELSRVGIRFKGRKGNTAVIKYHKGKLRLDLPKLAVFDETEDIIRNLVAYEQTSVEGGAFCGYAIMMDSLIDTAEDLAILYRAGVLENHLGSDERLLHMWNSMCVNISEITPQRWEDMCVAILRHYKSHWRVVYVEFCAKFFSRPWLWLSTIAAVLLLVMSALQTIYSVLSFYHA